MLDSQSQLSISYPLLIPQKGLINQAKAVINLFHGRCPDHIFMILLNFKQAMPHPTPKKHIKIKTIKEDLKPHKTSVQGRMERFYLNILWVFLIRKGFFFGWQILSHFLSCPVIAK